MLSALLWSLTLFGSGYKWQLSDTDSHDFSATNVTSAAWVELMPATTKAAFAFEIFNGQGNALELGFGASGSETAKIIILAGGNDRQEYFIPLGTRLSLRAKGTSATTGLLYINLFTNE